jgi:broad specificity phosphatase PhoE
MAKAMTVLCVLFLLSPAPVLAQKLVILARHAERADGGAMSGTAEKDPPLSAAGEARAAKLAAMLADSGITAIFASEFKRTQDTAKPVAVRLGLTVQSMPADNTSQLVARIRKEHANGIVLIVGHSDTLPAIIKALGGPGVTIPDNEFDNLFVLAPASKAFTRLRFSPVP